MNAPAENLRAEDRLLTFEVAGDFYAIPIAGVLEVADATRVTCIPTLPTKIGGVINYHGDALPVLNCSSLFEINESALRRLLLTRPRVAQRIPNLPGRQPGVES